MKNISPDQPLARGRTADVYDWDESHVLKLFHHRFELEDIEHEQQIARAVYASGVKSPAVGELIQFQGRNGLIYERVMGDPMLDMFQRKPWRVFTYSRILAQLHAQIHANILEADVPHQHRKLQNKINDANALSVSLKSSLLRALDSMPKGDCACHGDFHPANILIYGKNVTVIDWMDASRGNPLADVARTSIILIGAAESAQVPNSLLKIFVRVFHSAYLRHYFRLRPNGRDEYRRWLPIVAGARLNENIPELEQWLIQQARKIN